MDMLIRKIERAFSLTKDFRGFGMKFLLDQDVYYGYTGEN